MGKFKVVDYLISAISALANAAKSLLKFIDYIIKIRKQPASGTA